MKMANGEKTSKLKEIKETVSGAVEIMHQIRAPGVQESFGNIMDTAKIVKEIIEVLKTPEMVKNIENVRLISENMNDVSTKMQNTLQHLEETGVITEAKELVRSAKNTVDSFSGSSQDLHEISTSIKEMFKSIRVLVDELRVTVVS
jgi:DNA repair ATPase RecN